MSELTNALITYDDVIAKTNIDVLRKIAKVHDFAIFDKGNYNLNIWGIRCNTVDTSTFNDLLLVFYKANDANPKMNGKWTYDWFSITTDQRILNSPNMTKHITKTFKVGKHKGDYPALVQVKPLPLYRDNNRDNKLDLSGRISYEMAGINIHRASKWKIIRTIGLYSAGCQVFESVRDYEDKFMPLVNKAKDLYGNSFTYTLTNIKEFEL